MSLALALLLAASPADGAIAAERAFASAAQTEGQRTAFRQFAAPHAVMFVPEAINVHEALEGRPDPVISLMWWPARSFASCDGRIVVNTGSWISPRSGAVGYFTTIWELQPDGNWRWILDHGDVLETPRPVAENPPVRQAICPATPLTHAAEDEFEQSPDGTLRWAWQVADDNARTVRIELYDGSGYETVLLDEIAAPSQ
jgi:hypothetical protein